jgi:hypothetical protein
MSLSVVFTTGGAAHGSSASGLTSLTLQAGDYIVVGQSYENNGGISAPTAPSLSDTTFGTASSLALLGSSTSSSDHYSWVGWWGLVAPRTTSTAVLTVHNDGAIFDMTHRTQYIVYVLRGLSSWGVDGFASFSMDNILPHSVIKTIGSIPITSGGSHSEEVSLAISFERSISVGSNSITGTSSGYTILTAPGAIDNASTTNSGAMYGIYQQVIAGTAIPGGATFTWRGVVAETRYVHYGNIVISSGSAPPPSVPAKITHVVATSDSSLPTSINLSWDASPSGDNVTQYTVAATPSGSFGGLTVTGFPPVPSTTVTGLTNGTSYTFTVTATNSVGTSTPSDPSNSATAGGSGSTPPPTSLVDRLYVGEIDGDTGVDTILIEPSDGSGFVLNDYIVIAHAYTHNGSITTAPGTPTATGAGSSAPTFTLLDSHYSTTDNKAWIGWYGGLMNGPSSNIQVYIPNSPSGATPVDNTYSSGFAIYILRGLDSWHIESTTIWDPDHLFDSTHTPVDLSESMTPTLNSVSPEALLGVTFQRVNADPPGTLSGPSNMVEDTIAYFAGYGTWLAGAWTDVSTTDTTAAIDFTWSGTFDPTYVHFAGIMVGATPIAAPSALTGVVAALSTTTNLAVDIEWDPSPDAERVTEYDVTPNDTTASTTGTVATITGSPPDSFTTVTGLTHGHVYDFDVTATNVTGTSTPTTSNSVTILSSFSSTPSELLPFISDTESSAQQLLRFLDQEILTPIQDVIDRLVTYLRFLDPESISGSDTLSSTRLFVALIPAETLATISAGVGRLYIALRQNAPESLTTVDIVTRSKAWFRTVSTALGTIQDRVISGRAALFRETLPAIQNTIKRRYGAIRRLVPESTATSDSLVSQALHVIVRNIPSEVLPAIQNSLVGGVVRRILATDTLPVFFDTARNAIANVIDTLPTISDIGNLVKIRVIRIIITEYLPPTLANLVSRGVFRVNIVQRSELLPTVFNGPALPKAPLPLINLASSDGTGHITFGSGDVTSPGQVITVQFIAPRITAPTVQLFTRNDATRALGLTATATIKGFTITAAVAPERNQPSSTYDVAWQLV